MKNLFTKYLNFLNSIIVRNLRIQKILIDFTDRLSSFLHYCFFDLRGLLPLVTFFGIFVLWRSSQLDLFFVALDLYGYSWDTLKLAYQCYITTDMVIVILVYLALFELTILCTILINIPIINKELKLKYGDGIVKQRGFNHVGAMLARVTGVLTATTGICYAAHTYRKILETEAVRGQNGREIEVAAEQGRPPVLSKYPHEQVNSQVNGDFRLHGSFHHKTPN